MPLYLCYNSPLPTVSEFSNTFKIKVISFLVKNKERKERIQVEYYNLVIVDLS